MIPLISFPAAAQLLSRHPEEKGQTADLPEILFIFTGNMIVSY